MIAENSTHPTTALDLFLQPSPEIFANHIETGDHIFVIATGRNHLVWNVAEGMPLVLLDGDFHLLNRDEYQPLGV
jgi:hypothetical protein